MASKTTAIVGLLLAMNLLSFAAVQACEPNCSSGNRCPINTLQLQVCTNVLNVVELRVPPTEHCCRLINGLTDLEAAACLCTAVKADVLGIVDLDVRVGISLVLNRCGKTCPPDFTCSR